MKFEFPFPILEPWAELVDNGEALVEELKKEVRKDGILYCESVRPIAWRTDCDDVLFQIEGEKVSFAVVHLTWSGKKDPNKGWPFTTIYSDLNAWKSECMEPDHEDFTC